MRTTPTSSSTSDATPFGRALRSWRMRRGVSQLDLARRAATTPRYVSFLETGRSRPSAEMVMRLARTLAVPLRQRNALLRAAGHPPAFPEHALGDARLAPYRAIVDHMLAQQEPYPAYVLDGQWRLVRTNQGGRWFMEALGISDGGGDNVLLAIVQSPVLRAQLENFAEVAWTAVGDLERDMVASGDEALVALYDEAVRALADVPPPESLDRSAAVVAPRLRLGDRVVSTVSTVVRFGNAQEVALDELRVELVFPTDEPSREALRQLAGQVD